MAKAKITTFEQEMAKMMQSYTTSVFQRMNEPIKLPLKVYPLGSLLLDAVTHAGGGLFNGFTQLYGPDSAGKTTQGVQCAAENSRLERQVVVFDFEQKLLPEYLLECLIAAGGNPDFVAFIRPGSGKDGLEMLHRLAGKIDIAIIDSIGAIPHTKTITLKAKDGIEHVFMGSHARLIGDWVQAMRFIINRSGAHDDVPVRTGILALNQVRASFSGYGDGLHFPGGWQWRHSLALNIKITRGKKQDKDNNKVMGRIRALVVKNQIGVPNHEITYPITFGKGVDLDYDTLKAGVDFGIIKNRSAHYFLDGEKLAHGEYRALEQIRKMPLDTLYELRGRIHAAIVAGKEKEPDEPIQAAE